MKYNDKLLEPATSITLLISSHFLDEIKFREFIVPRQELIPQQELLSTTEVKFFVFFFQEALLSQLTKNEL